MDPTLLRTLNWLPVKWRPAKRGHVTRVANSFGPGRQVAICPVFTGVATHPGRVVAGRVGFTATRHEHARPRIDRGRVLRGTGNHTRDRESGSLSQRPGGGRVSYGRLGDRWRHSR